MGPEELIPNLQVGQSLFAGWDRDAARLLPPSTLRPPLQYDYFDTGERIAKPPPTHESSP
jgi:hypothetical protein